MPSAVMPKIGDFDTKRDYIFGRSSAETQRLMLQSTLLEPTTRRLLERAGLQTGMRVLDVGCGAGDVSLLIGEMVGPTGQVIGIDHDAKVLATARERAAERGLAHVQFQEHALERFEADADFDMIFGRYILLHQNEPWLLLKRLSRLLRKGGVLAFHEPDLRYGQFSTPPVPVYETLWTAIWDAFNAVLPHPEVAHNLVAYFAEAGLPQPQLFSETPLDGGAESIFHPYVVSCFANLRPAMEKHGFVPAALAGCSYQEIEEKSRAQAAGSRSQLRLHQQICAWVRPDA